MEIPTRSANSAWEVLDKKQCHAALVRGVTRSSKEQEEEDQLSLAPTADSTITSLDHIRIRRIKNESKPPTSKIRFVPQDFDDSILTTSSSTISDQQQDVAATKARRRHSRSTHSRRRRSSSKKKRNFDKRRSVLEPIKDELIDMNEFWAAESEEAARRNNEQRVIQHQYLRWQQFYSIQQYQQQFQRERLQLCQSKEEQRGTTLKDRAHYKHKSMRNLVVNTGNDDEEAQPPMNRRSSWSEGMPPQEVDQVLASLPVSPPLPCHCAHWQAAVETFGSFESNATATANDQVTYETEAQDEVDAQDNVDTNSFQVKTTGEYQEDCATNTEEPTVDPKKETTDARVSEEHNDVAAPTEEVIEIYAPPGKLGIVLYPRQDGQLAVHEIKQSSILKDQVQLGDLLIALNDEDVRMKSAIEVTKMIGRLMKNATRKFSLVRPPQQIPAPPPPHLGDQASVVPAQSSPASQVCNDASALPRWGDDIAAPHEELIEICAPPGKLGVLFHAGSDGQLAVTKTRPDSVLKDKVQVGDKVLALDGEDVRLMSNKEVTRMISSKIENMTRRFTIVRQRQQKPTHTPTWGDKLVAQLGSAKGIDQPNHAGTPWEELFEIHAPAGKLGIVLNPLADGQLAVLEVRANSVLKDKLQVGDRVLAIDDDDVRMMSPKEASKIIGNKKDKTRRFSIVRTLDGPVSKM